MAGYKTIAFNALAIVVALAVIFGYSQFTPSDDTKTIIEALPVIVALGNIILRAVTKTSIFKSE